MDFFLDAIDSNTRTAYAIYQEFNMRQDLKEFNENIIILIEKHLNDTN